MVHSLELHGPLYPLGPVRAVGDACPQCTIERRSRPCTAPHECRPHLGGRGALGTGVPRQLSHGLSLSQASLHGTSHRLRVLDAADTGLSSVVQHFGDEHRVSGAPSTLTRPREGSGPRMIFTVHVLGAATDAVYMSVDVVVCSPAHRHKSHRSETLCLTTHRHC